jgi:sulfatase modifying factor 1
MLGKRISLETEKYLELIRYKYIKIPIKTKHTRFTVTTKKGHTMKMLKFYHKYLKLFIVPLLLLFSFGCNDGGGGSSDPLTVEITGWYMENADESAVSKYGDKANATAYIYISLKVKDPDGIDDVIYVEVSNPQDRYWILRDSSSGIDLYDPEYKRFIANGLWSSVNPNSIILGQYTAFVLDSDFNSATNTINFSSPGTTLPEEGFIYSEDYKRVTDGGIEMLKRASITNFVKGEDSITIEFQVDDTRVFNGYVWIYDGSPEYITYSDYFINTINYGSGIFNDGTTNTLTIQSSDLDLGSYTWDDINGFHVILTDGVQYSPKETWDHRSVSQYKTIGCADVEGCPAPPLMSLIPSGCFDMGDAFNEGYTEELPVHNVCITSNFYMDVHEVTNAEYAVCVSAGGCTAPSDSSSETRASYYGNPVYNDYPVIYVSWNQVDDYCAWAGKRLPTEAEWEFAARGGLSGKRYPWGDTLSGTYANYSDSGDPWDNDTSPVGYYAANGYGLYDMAGNVFEWVNDQYQNDYYHMSPTNDPPGPASGVVRVLRGGGWDNDTSYLRVAGRTDNTPSVQHGNKGFRCAGD